MRNPMNSLHATGFPPRPTRRGGRGKPSPIGQPSEHLQNLTSAMSAGNHAQAKRHAFALIRSLPEGKSGTPLPPQQADADEGDDAPAPAKASGSASPSNSGRLAQMLKGRKAPMAAAAPAAGSGY